MLIFENGNYYTLYGKSKLLCSLTTGACSAIAAKGAALYYFLGEESCLNNINFITQEGLVLTSSLASCKKISPSIIETTVIKLGGDDKDATSGLEICATLHFLCMPISNVIVNIKGGEGVGKVTKEGLKVPEGEAAINPVPRLMITKAVEDVCKINNWKGKIDVIISVLGGKEAAIKTFNQRLGIVDGISILGTTGLVEPFSCRAFVDSIQLELNQLSVEEKTRNNWHLLISIGNAEKDFIEKNEKLKRLPKIICSNYIGETLDMVQSMNWKHITIIGHIGKIIKIAGGIMDTHSNIADCRLELVVCHAALNEAPLFLLKNIMLCTTVETALLVIKKYSLSLFNNVISSLYTRMQYYLNNRVQNKCICDIIMFSDALGYIDFSKTTIQ